MLIKSVIIHELRGLSDKNGGYRYFNRELTRESSFGRGSARSKIKTIPIINNLRNRKARNILKFQIFIYEAAFENKKLKK